MNFRAVSLLIFLAALIAGCEPPAEQSSEEQTAGAPDVVSGASQPAGPAEGEAIVFDSAGTSLTLEELVTTGNVIWAMDFIAPDTMIFTERQGAVKLLNTTTNEITSVDGGPDVHVSDSGGLFDVMVDPDFANNGFIFFTYIKGLGEQSAVAVARSRLEGKKLVDTQDLFVANNPSDDHAHWGSRVIMDNERYLFFTSGDRHVPDNAQSTSSHGGKVLRIRADGGVPDDNPFAGEAGAAPEIWSIGHRNPQGLFLDPGSGVLFEQEHGPTGGDEINRIEKAVNYGWPIISYGDNIWGDRQPEGTEREGLEQPLAYFKPGIAPTGICIYRGDRIPGWQGSVFSSTLRGYVVRLELAGDAVASEERLLTEWGERLRDVVEGPDGSLYLASEAGKIGRIVPVESNL